MDEEQSAHRIRKFKNRRIIQAETTVGQKHRPSIEVEKYEHSSSYSKLDLSVTEIVFGQHSHQNVSSQMLESNREREKAIAQLITFPVYETIHRNAALSAPYAHFLVPSLLLHLELEILNGPSPKIEDSIKQITSRLQKPEIKSQLKQKQYYNLLTLVVRREKITVKRLHQFLREFMRQERQVLVSVLPYYFNLFALVANKQVIFRGEDPSCWIVYTFEHPACTQSFTAFSREDIVKVWKEVEYKASKMYHIEEE